MRPKKMQQIGSVGRRFLRADGYDGIEDQNRPKDLPESVFPRKLNLNAGEYEEGICVIAHILVVGKLFRRRSVHNQG
jgi:hypothetical protein